MTTPPSLTYRYVRAYRNGAYQIDCVATIDGVRYACRATGRNRTYTFGKARAGLARMIAPMFTGPFVMEHISHHHERRITCQGGAQ